jgi:hypothetical protein
MDKEHWPTAFHDAYVDLHAAYLALTRLRHLRRGSPEEVVRRDMEKDDLFGIGDVPAGEARKKWEGIWQKNVQADAMARVMACVAECMQEHWKSWAPFMDQCPEDLRKFKISVPFDAYLLTATTVSRSTIEKRARVLREALDRRARGQP